MSVIGKALSWIRIFLLSLCMTIFVVCGLIIHAIFNLSTKARFSLRRNFCIIGMWILGIKNEEEIEFENVADQGPYLFVCNHRTLLDPLICARYVNAYFLGKAEIASYPVLGKGSELTGAIFVKRDDRSSRKASRDTIVEALSKGWNVLLYPEGTTNGGDTTKDFYKGTFEIASEMDVPVVPVMVEYKKRSDYWVTPGLLKKSVEQFSKWRTVTHTWVGQPVHGQDALKLMSDVRLLIDQKITEVQRAWGNSIHGLV